MLLCQLPHTALTKHFAIINLSCSIICRYNPENLTTLHSYVEQQVCSLHTEKYFMPYLLLIVIVHLIGK